MKTRILIELEIEGEPQEASDRVEQILDGGDLQDMINDEGDEDVGPLLVTSSVQSTLLDDLREILWPRDDPNADWSPDTIDAIAQRLAFLRPDESIPPCAASMGCLCAGHARGNDAAAACDTSEPGPDLREMVHRFEANPEDDDLCTLCRGLWTDPIHKPSKAEIDAAWDARAAALHQGAKLGISPLDEDEPEPETMSCPACGGDCGNLGRLGNRAHFRCRACGLDCSQDVGS
jgi:hypothetical protein